MKLYKLTDENHETQNKTKWGPGITHTAKGTGTQLCTDDVIHAYENPYVAVLLNPSHAGFKKPVLWEASGEGVIREGQLKCGVKSLTTVKIIELPVLTTEQRTEIAVRCAKEACTAESWNRWADGWLDGTDRTKKSAARASYAASYATIMASSAAYYAASYAAFHAARSAMPDAAADAACDAAPASALAAYYATQTNPRLDLIGIINEVMTKKVMR